MTDTEIVGFGSQPRSHQTLAQSLTNHSAVSDRYDKLQIPHIAIFTISKHTHDLQCYSWTTAELHAFHFCPKK